MKSYFNRIADDITLIGIEKFADRLMEKYEQNGMEIAKGILQIELAKAMEELTDDDM